MRILWLTNGDANVAEDYILPGLQAIGCTVEVHPWKVTFDERRDPLVHGGHGYTVRLGGEFQRQSVGGHPDLIVVSRAWRERDRVESVLDHHAGVPVVYFCGEDLHHDPPEWVHQRCARAFVAHCSPNLAAKGWAISLPCCARADLVAPPEAEKPFHVVYGGKISSGHGGRAPLIAPAIGRCLIDDTVTFGSWDTWMWRLAKARFSISIGGAGNYPVAGANVSYFEAGAAGASLIALPHGLVVEPAIPGAVEFTTGEQLVALCEAARSGDLKPAMVPMELRRWTEAHHSHTARARQLLEYVGALA